MKKVILVLLLIPVFLFAGYDIVFVGPDSNGGEYTDIITGLAGFAGDFDTVDLWDLIATGTPVLGDIQGYDAVVACSESGLPDPVALGDVLADYVDGGGVLVLCTFAYGGNIEITGRIMTTGYSPLLLNSNPGHYSWDDLDLADPDEPGSPLLDSVSSLGCGYRDDVYLAGWGNLVAHWDGDNDEAVAYNDAHSVVSISAFPGHVSGGYDWTGDYPQLIRNSIMWMLPPVSIQSTSLGSIKVIFE